MTYHEDNAAHISARKKKIRREAPEHQMLARAKQRAKKSGVPFTITLSDIQVPVKCPYLGICLYVGHEVAGPNSPSLDRIIPELGYIPGNIEVVSHRANTAKNDFTPEELLYFAEAIIKRYGN